jgi:hypothetical protein
MKNWQRSLIVLATGAAIATASAASAVNVFNTTFNDPSGLTFGTLLGGAEESGNTPNPTNYGYILTGPAGTAGNFRDYQWVHDMNGTAANALTGMWFDLGGQANQLAVFPIIDHGPVLQESFEYDVYMSNDLSTWTEATLDALYTEGWDPNPNIADGYTTVWKMPTGQTFRYATVAWGNPGNPDPTYAYADGDCEIDAVAGLTELGGGVSPVPEPASALLLGGALMSAGLVAWRKKR